MNINNSHTYSAEDRYKVEDAFAKSLEIVYDIKETTTPRQRSNGTRAFLMPTGQELACYKSGYVRKYNGYDRWYQLNKKYQKETRTTVSDFYTGQLHTRTLLHWEREMIYSQLTRMRYMLAFYLRNYKTNTNTNR